MGLFDRFSKKPVPLEEQLKVLASCNITLNPGMGVEHLLESQSREVYEKEPYEPLLIALGNTMEREPWSPLSDSIWHLDTECIEDHGSYAQIASRIAALAGAELPLNDIKDYVDIDEEKAWLSFRLGDQQIKWEAEVDNDWMDFKILKNFVRLLKERNAQRRLTYFDLGQDCLITCSSEDEFKRLKELTRMSFKWLE